MSDDPTTPAFEYREWGQIHDFMRGWGLHHNRLRFCLWHCDHADLYKTPEDELKWLVLKDVIRERVNALKRKLKRFIEPRPDPRIAKMFIPAIKHLTAPSLLAQDIVGVQPLEGYSGGIEFRMFVRTKPPVSVITRLRLLFRKRGRK